MLLFGLCVQEKRRAERAEIQRVRAEKDKERQARREVTQLLLLKLSAASVGDFILSILSTVVKLFKRIN